MKEGTKERHTIKRYYLRHAVPVLVWLVATTGVAWLFYQRAGRFEVVGIARTQVRQVAASSTGRIKEIPFELFAPVRTGQTVATLDTVCDNEQLLKVELETELATAGAEAERLLALLVPTQEQLQADQANLKISREDNWRRFVVDVETAHLEVLKTDAEIASDQVMLDGYAVDVKIFEKLLAADAIAPHELEKVKVEHDSLARKIEENKRLRAEAERALKLAEQRRDEFAKYDVPRQSEDAALEAIRKEVHVQEELMKGLMAQLGALKTRRAVELKSPIDGIIVPIHPQQNDALQQTPGEQTMRRPGEVVTAGEPILAVAQTEPNEIVAYVSERQLGHFEKGISVELVKTRTPAQIARSTVVAIGPTIELMPPRLWRNPQIPQWGRPVLVEIPQGLALVPGELVGIRRL